MNWYEHHIGDYDKNTSHLTACEDGIYSRLIRRYYDKEKPLPADVNEVKRVARARSRDERAAVDTVLAEFFHLEEDGWHHKVCDEVIFAYQAGEPEREAKKKNEDTRLARHRAERADLFAVINGAGVHLAWNTPMADLRAAAARIQGAETATPETPLQPKPATQPATATATPATATQPPPTNHHPPLPSISSLSTLVPEGDVVGGPALALVPPPAAFLGEKNEAAIPPRAVVPLGAAWELPERWGTDAEALGFTPSEILREAERYRQYWVEGKGKGTRRTTKGWRQSWSNWLAKAEPQRRTS